MSNQFIKSIHILTLTIVLSLTLQACPLVVLGGAVSGIAVVANDRRTIGSQTDDRNIQLRANSYFKQDLPQTAHIEVTSYNRRVLLAGQVTSANDKAYAEKIVRSIDNVREVINELEISPIISESKQSKDTIITGKVKAAFLANKQIPSNYFRVVTVAGVVYLMGLVSKTEGEYATQLASSINGVIKVVKVFEYIEESNFKQSRPQSELNQLENNPSSSQLEKTSEKTSNDNVNQPLNEKKSIENNISQPLNNFSNLKVQTLD